MWNVLRWMKFNIWSSLLSKRNQYNELFNGRYIDVGVSSIISTTSSRATTAQRRATIHFKMDIILNWSNYLLVELDMSCCKQCAEMIFDRMCLLFNCFFCHTKNVHDRKISHNLDTSSWETEWYYRLDEIVLNPSSCAILCDMWWLWLLQRQHTDREFRVI